MRREDEQLAADASRARAVRVLRAVIPERFAVVSRRDVGLAARGDGGHVMARGGRGYLVREFAEQRCARERSKRRVREPRREPPRHELRRGREQRARAGRKCHAVRVAHDEIVDRAQPARPWRAAAAAAERRVVAQRACVRQRGDEVASQRLERGIARGERGPGGERGAQRRRALWHTVVHVEVVVARRQHFDLETRARAAHSLALQRELAS